MYSLMIVDADRNFSKTLQQLLPWKDLGFEIISSITDGQEAREAAAILKPDVLITDIHLPSLDGLSLAKALREGNPLTKLIILTAEHDFRYAQEAITYHVERYLLKPVQAGELEETMRKVRESMDARPLSRREILNSLFNGQRDEALYSIIRSGDKAAASAFIDEIFLNMSAPGVSLSECQMQVIQLYFIIARTAKKLIPEFDLNVERNLTLIMQIFSEESPEEIQAWLRRLCHNVMDYVAYQLCDNDASLSSRGYNYLKKHYADPDLSLKTVSEHLHISSNYFSSIFKKAMGDSFTNVLNQIRMEHAKELLLSSNKKILEIAHAVGYTDPHYFSFCFKKHFGESPNEVRHVKRR